MTKQQIQNLTEGYSQNPETKKIERVVCYIRVSTTEQKLHGLSLDAQRDTLTRYAESHGLKIVGWYEDEGVSGRKLIRRRPALQRMLNDAKENMFDRIIFIKLDRYFRSVAEYHESQKILEKHKVLWTATEEVYDLTTANGRYWVQQKLAMAEYEADNTGERIKLVNDYKVRDGQALTGPQSQGIGFTVQKIDGVKRVVQDPETKDLVMDYINHFLTYQNRRQATVDINAKYNTNIHYNSFGKMLKNTKLYGHYKGNDNYCTAYIDKATFDKIQSILNGRNLKTQRTKRIYIFSGLIKCPKCSNNLAGGTSKCRQRITPNGKVYRYDKDIKQYRCNKCRVSKLCDWNTTINEAKIEAAMLLYFNDYVKAHIKEVKIADGRRKSSNAEKRVKDLNEELRKLNRMYRAGNITDKEYDTDSADIKERLALAEAQLQPMAERDLTIYEDLMKSNWRDIYEALDETRRRAFWRKYAKQVVLDENGKLDRVIFF